MAAKSAMGGPIVGSEHKRLPGYRPQGTPIAFGDPGYVAPHERAIPTHKPSFTEPAERGRESLQVATNRARIAEAEQSVTLQQQANQGPVVNRFTVPLDRTQPPFTRNALIDPAGIRKDQRTRAHDRRQVDRADYRPVGSLTDRRVSHRRLTDVRSFIKDSPEFARIKAAQADPSVRSVLREMADPIPKIVQAELAGERSSIRDLADALDSIQPEGQQQSLDGQIYDREVLLWEATDTALEFIGTHHRPASELTALVEQIVKLHQPQEDTDG